MVLDSGTGVTTNNSCGGAPSGFEPFAAVAGLGTSKPTGGETKEDEVGLTSALIQSRARIPAELVVLKVKREAVVRTFPAPVVSYKAVHTAS